MRIAALMLLSLLPVTAAAADTPSVILTQGHTTITLAVVNRTADDAAGLTVTAESDVLPGWLTVTPDVRTVDVPDGDSTAALELGLTVTGAPSGAAFDLPLVFTDDTGREWRHTVPLTVDSAAPDRFALTQNTPNPFNPATTIRYALPAAADVRLTVYSSLGQAVRTLVDGRQSAGVHTAVWDGRDDDGRTVAGGVYLYTLRAGGYSRTLKMLFVR